MKITVTFDVHPGRPASWPEPIENLLDELTVTGIEEFRDWVGDYLKQRRRAERAEGAE